MKHTQGECPCCHKNTLNYGDSGPQDSQYYYKWACTNCGASGTEWYDMRFFEHEIRTTPEHLGGGTKVLSRDGKREGTCTGKVRPCRMEGCRGRQVAVRWPKIGKEKRDKTTYCCGKGMRYIEEGENAGKWRLV